MNDSANRFNIDSAYQSLSGPESIRDLDNDAYDNLIFDHFVKSDFDAVKTALRMRNGYERIDIDFSNVEINDPSVIKCTIRPDGSCVFVFSISILALVMNFSMVARLIIWHWIHSVPLFVTYARRGRPPADFILNVADDPHHHGLAFCNCDDTTILVPDPYFMRSRGYQDLRNTYRSNDIPWIERNDSALWRGSNTGEIIGNDMAGLPRVRLCAYAARHPDLIDAGLTSIVQVVSPADASGIDLTTYAKPYIPVGQFIHWKYQIDIDGMTSSWPGFFSKLLSGSVVLKVDSIKGWKQWYYDRLTPWFHYVPIRSDFSDLVAIIEFLQNHQNVAQEIASSAAALVGDFTYDREVDKAVDHLTRIAVETNGIAIS